MYVTCTYVCIYIVIYMYRMPLAMLCFLVISQAEIKVSGMRHGTSSLSYEKFPALKRQSFSRTG